MTRRRTPLDADYDSWAAAHDDTPLGVLADGHRPTDVGNADRLAAAADGAIRYLPAWRKWFVYRDGAWRIDDAEALVTEEAKQVAAALFRRAGGLAGHERDAMWKWAKRSESAASLAAMVKLARGIPGIATNHRDLDAHPWLLNVINGTIDLRSGELLAHNPEHLITRQALVIFDPAATAPLWERCLAQWQPDPAVRDYLQVAIGSAATGIAVQRLIANIGAGGNGKGAFFNAITATLGPDYVVVPHKSLLIVQRHEQHPTVTARLLGSRLAVAAETDAGDRLDEAKLKEITGGDLLEARRMHEDPWQFSPSWTLFLHSNNRPRIRGTDQGIWRRTRLVPWPTSIPIADQDDKLSGRLADEASGVLNWIAAGAAIFAAEGLTDPDAITAATGEYRSAEDHLGAFLADACVIDETRSVAASELRVTYEAWAEEAGETPWTAKALGAELNRRGFDRARLGQRRRSHWIGFDIDSAKSPENQGSEPV